MPTKTKSVATSLANFHNDARLLPLAAEIKLREYAALYHQDTLRLDRRNLSFDPADAFLLRSAGFDLDDPLEMRRAFARVSNEQNFAATGGTVADLAAAQAAANEAADREKTEVGKIDNEMAALQARRDQITSNTRRLQEAADARKVARETLAKVLPSFVEDTITMAAKRAVAGGADMGRINAMTRQMRDAYV